MRQNKIIVTMLMVVLLLIGGVSGGQYGNQYGSIAPDASIVKCDNAKVVQPSDDIIAAYDWLASSDRDAAMGTLSWNNRRTLLCAPGLYPVTPPWTLNTNFVDVAGLGDVVIYTTSTQSAVISQTAKDVRLSDLTIYNNHASSGICLQIANETRGADGYNMNNALTGTNCGAGVRDAIDTRRPDEIYIWHYAYEGVDGWYDIKSVTDSNNIVLATSSGISMAGTTRFAVCPQQSRYTNLTFLSNGHYIYTAPVIGHLGGTWVNCHSTGYGAWYIYESANDTDVIEGAAVLKGTTPGTVGITIAGHTVALHDAVSFASTTNYQAGKYQVVAIAYSETPPKNTTGLTIRAPEVAEDLTGKAMTIYRAENRADMTDCSGTIYAFTGDLARGTGGTLRRCFGTTYAFGGCNMWGSPILEGALIEDCGADYNSYALGSWIAGTVRRSSGGFVCFAGSADSVNKGYITATGIVDECTATYSGTGTSFGQGTNERNRNDGEIENCRFGTQAQYLAGTSIAVASAGNGVFKNNYPGKPINNVTGGSPVSISAFDNGATYTNTGAAGAVHYDLPPAVVGLTYTIQRSSITAGDDINIDPYGVEIINGIDGAALVATTKELTNTADDCSNVVLRCYVAGVWTVVYSSNIASWVTT